MKSTIIYLLIIVTGLSIINKQNAKAKRWIDLLNAEV